MANQLSKTGIADTQTLYAAHVTQSIDAFTGVEAYDISISGSLNTTGSLNNDGDFNSINGNFYTISPSIKFEGPTYVYPSSPYNSFQMLLNAVTVDQSGNPYMTTIFDTSFVNLLNFPDDATAAFNNIPVGGLYHTNGIIKIRII